VADLSELVALINNDTRITVLTGAGISAESGIPTFRDAENGLWANYRPEDLASLSAFQRNPTLLWEWYNWRREMVMRAAPNAGHHALVQLQAWSRHFTLVTQNVDQFHQRAGSTNVIELHGNLMTARRFDENEVLPLPEKLDSLPPYCPVTGKLLRPNIIWFGESLPSAAVNAAEKASLECDVFLSIGTSGLVYPAAGLPVMAMEKGAVVVEVNPDETTISDMVSMRIPGRSSEVLPELVNRLINAGASY
jgi:NAD-dependent deacetylase